VLLLQPTELPKQPVSTPINAIKKGLETRHFLEMQSSVLRYFSPKEMASLHGFPSRFEFPTSKDAPGIRTQMALVGNSLNVMVVSRLMEHLLTNGGS
jgi:site-specific DNA-cytosine methylase